MLTARYVRENLDEIKQSMQKRQWEYDFDLLLGLDEQWRELVGRTQELKAKLNKSSLEISRLKKNKDQGGANKLIAELPELKKEIESQDKELGELEGKLNKLLLNMPNILHGSVPFGKDDNDNVVVKKVGEPSKKPAKGHEEILSGLGMLDIERAAKSAGARFYYLKGDMVLLEQSLLRYCLDILSKKGFTPIEPPFMLRESLYKKVTALGDFDEVLYKIDSEDGLRMIATSEHPIAAMYSDEVLEKTKLPLKYAGISPCFRMEAGTHGKDTKGIFRVHQFNKIEQFAFTRQEDSWALFEEMQKNVEEIFEGLKIPYRVVNVCTGDIGIVAAKKYDLEAYLPTQGKYREMSSCSNCTDWQSMRLNIKYDDGEERKFVHTINSTAIATTRALVAIVENYLNDDGTIGVPEVLVPYMGKRKIG